LIEIRQDEGCDCLLYTLNGHCQYFSELEKLESAI